MTPDGNSDLRVLVHAPVGRDAPMIAEVLRREQIAAEPCPTLEGVASELGNGAGALVIADDALNRSAVERIAAWAGQQEPWSDLPILVLTTGGNPDQTSLYRLRLIEPLGNVTLIERPVRKVTLISSVRTALRARQRQYEIRNHLQELARSESRLRAAIQEAPIPIMIHAGDGEVLSLSRAWTECSGYTIEDIPTTHVWAELAYGSRAAEVDEQMAANPASGAVKPGREVEILAKSGKTRVWTFSWSELPPLADGRKLFVRAAVDMTEHNAVTDALRRANLDLEQFAYAAAHDLQEPIRNVSLYTQLLAKHVGGKLDPLADGYVTATIENARRMQNLIQDLLAYTRAVGDADHDEETDANLVMEDVLQNLRTAIEMAQGQVTYDHLPTVRVPAPQLMQLLQNLVSNALKYRGDQPARVHVHADRKDKEWLFTVEDNGVGVPQQHQDRIFKVFKRLHGREIPGTGIGLAICQRVVNHYGGRIWVESESGKGSSFRFTIPFRKAA
jgi:PAS domain S-box-containing protein